MSIWEAPAYLRDQFFEERQEKRDRERFSKLTTKQRRKAQFTRFQRKEMKAPYRSNTAEHAAYYIDYKDRLKRDRFHRQRYGVTPMKPVDMTKRWNRPPVWSSVPARKYYPMRRIKRESRKRVPLTTRVVQDIKRNRLPYKPANVSWYSPQDPYIARDLRKRFIEKTNKY